AMNPARAAREAARAPDDDRWIPPVLSTVASQGEGVPQVLEALDRHFRYLEHSGVLHQRRRARLRDRVVEVVERTMRQRLWSDPGAAQWLDEQLAPLETGESDPFAVAEELLARSGHLLMRRESDAR
ncbi:MAG TPA: methylmalonyl Co-A mutase-associated GTPase MeaB, partial [Gemmatimonadaceae bacterium]|nr:methylmalonyl Co-A mutase-associated GTPase MeaB [Gemmatimonadaceae bacterium]